MSGIKLVLEWFVLIKDQEYMIRSTAQGGDPLTGYHDWKLAPGGPYSSWSEACLWVPTTSPNYKHSVRVAV